MLVRVLGGLVEEEQICAIPSRSVHDNLYLIGNPLGRVGKISGNGEALVVDQSKAVDRVDHTYLAVILEAADLGPDFCRWITTLYSEIKAVIKVNGFFTKPFRIERSVCHGCPLPPLLSWLLSFYCRSWTKYGGAFVYADDISIIVSVEGQLPREESIIIGYETVAGTKVI